MKLLMLGLGLLTSTAVGFEKFPNQKIKEYCIHFCEPTIRPCLAEKESACAQLYEACMKEDDPIECMAPINSLLIYRINSCFTSACNPTELDLEYDARPSESKTEAELEEQQFNSEVTKTRYPDVNKPLQTHMDQMLRPYPDNPNPISIPDQFYVPEQHNGPDEDFQPMFPIEDETRPADKENEQMQPIPFDDPENQSEQISEQDPN